MNIVSTTAQPHQIDADAIAVGIYADDSFPASAAALDRATEGRIARLKERGELTGKANETVALYALPGVKSPIVLVVGLGERAKLDAGAAFRAAGAAAKSLAKRQRGSVAFYLGEEIRGPLLESAVAGAIVGGEGQDIYRREKKIFDPETVLWADAGNATIQSGRILGESVNFARRLVNGPPDDIYPESFANAIEAMGRECGMDVEVWDKARLEKEKCGSLLAVAKGSSRDPRLVIARYRGAADAPTLALVGKGVTFDSGGLSIKPSDGMLTMKCDMAGAATVMGAIRAIALLKLPVNVTAFAGLVENLTGPSAYKLGDVLTARNGTTIEVHNTDAEGRLVLADVLDVAVSSGAENIVDLATLTGACVVALGTDVVGAMTNDQPWCDAVMNAARSVGEPIWQLPMFAEFNEQIESEVADIKNVGAGRWGGAITAAKLLERFVGDRPWTHLDIAGPAFREKPKAWCDAGASGEMVRTLVELARSR